MKRALFPVLLLAAAFRPVSPLLAAPSGAGHYDVSEYLMGSVAVNIVFPESSGAIRPSTENWSDTRKNQVVIQIQQALNWWVLREPKAKLSFTYTINTVPTGYEPINCNANPDSVPAAPCVEGDWIGEVMTNLGYSGTDHFEKVYNFNNARRTAAGTDWAITIFVADSYNDNDATPGEFPDGYFAYAYLGGPFMVMTYDNGGYGIGNMAAVASHETGHLFYALDEYADSHCTTAERTGYFNTQNVNCENTPVTNDNCIMRGGTQPYYVPAICDATKLMLGWKDSNINNIFDLADFPPTTELTAYSPDPTANNAPVYNGIARSIQAYTNANPYTTDSNHYWYTSERNNLSILKIAAVEYNVNGGGWQSAAARDGLFDQSIESFTFTPSALPDGAYTFAARAKDNFDVYDPAPPSDALLINTSLPTDIQYVNDGLIGDSKYVSNQHVLSANWGPSYHISGINHYEYAIGTGTLPGQIGTVVSWTSAGAALGVTRSGLTLSENSTYYFAVRAQNNNSFYSGASVSNGARVDTTSPTARVEISSPLPAKTGQLNLKLIITEVNGLSGNPALTFTPSGGSPQTVSLAYLSASTWTGAAFIQSFYSTGTASFSFSASDPALNIGTETTSGGSFTIDTAVSGVTGGTVVNSDNTAVTVPPGAYAGNLVVTISTVPPSRTALADAAGSDSSVLRANNLNWEFSAKTAAGVPVTNFSAPPTITLCYPDANNDGRIDGDFIPEGLARIYWLDESASRWTRVQGALPNTATKCLSAPVSHFSVYSIRALDSSQYGMDAIKAFPSPCYFDRAPYALTIRGIPVDAKEPVIYIYNAAGELVRELKQGDGIDSFSNEGVWNGRQKSGAKAASGLYIYLAKTGNYGKATGKFYIFW